MGRCSAAILDIQFGRPAGGGAATSSGNLRQLEFDVDYLTSRQFVCGTAGADFSPRPHSIKLLKLRFDDRFLWKRIGIRTGEVVRGPFSACDLIAPYAL